MKSNAWVVEGVFHPVISVVSLDEAIRFFRDAIGLRVTFDGYHAPSAIESLFGYKEPVVHSAVVECPDGSEIELIEFENPSATLNPLMEMHQTGLVALALRVEGLELLVQRLKNSGFEMKTEIVLQELPDGENLMVAVCSAPSDIRVILVEPPVGRKSLGS
jgi:hypothetical protein